MAFRGRGRGRGQGGFGGPRRSKEDPFVLFPDTDLPDATQVLPKKINDEELLLIKESLEWLKKSEYYCLEQADKNNCFQQYLVRSMFPTELMTRGSNVRKLSRGKVAWDRKKEESYWDRIEKIEQDKDAKEKKQTDEDKDKEDDDGDEEDDEDDEDPDMNDYIYDMQVDDDEDAYNDEDEGVDEPELEL